MNSAIQDSIEKEIVIRASKERVYAAITTPEQFVKWFSIGVEGGAKVHLKESGIASLPSEVIDQTLQGNSAGWDLMLGRLLGYLNNE